MASLNFDTPVRYLSGVGEKRAEQLEKLGIRDIKSLLRHFPRAYQHRGNIRPLSEARDGEIGAFLLTIGSEPKSARLKGRMILTKCSAFDESRSCVLTYFNQPYIKDVFKVGSTFRFWGKISIRAGRIELSSPDYEPYYEGRPLPEFTPLYPLTKGITNKYLSKIIDTALSALTVDEKDDPLPADIRQKAQLCDLDWSLRAIHRPANYDMMDRSRRRFVFEELFNFAIGVSMQRKETAETRAPIFAKTDMEPFLSAVGFELTGAQKRVISEIEADVTDDSGLQMCRMVSGDVGCGKTVCAAAAVWMTVSNGYQTAVMAPTAILATQHYNDLSALFGRLGYRVELLCGSTSAAKKRKIYTDLADGTLPIVIGTHALISSGVEFKKAGLFVTDEQHRFGVMQRAELSRKGEGELSAHTLVMSATPIPRTLALILYGDLDVSRVDEMPPGRQKVSTFTVDESYRARLNGFIRKQAQEGHRTYIVCPAIEAQEKDEDGSVSGSIVGLDYRAGQEDQPVLKSAVEYAEELRTHVFPDLRVELMHGRMKPAEKDDVMSRFAAGEIDVLVSTTVIEVGVNVPEATLMVVENAERFGLSQLHQLRGRVGRGKDKSWCILVSDSKGETAKARLKTMCETNDGYKIAQKDLELRGPGDYFASEDGARQHGQHPLALSAMCSDMDDLRLAFECAAETVKNDPTLSLPENAALAEEMKGFFAASTGTMN